jgi:hypothetical protein
MYQKSINSHFLAKSGAVEDKSVDLILIRESTGLRKMVRPKHLLEGCVDVRFENEILRILKSNGLLIQSGNLFDIDMFTGYFFNFELRAYHVSRKPLVDVSDQDQPINDIDHIGVYKVVDTPFSKLTFNPLQAPKEGTTSESQRWITTYLDSAHSLNPKDLTGRQNPPGPPIDILRTLIRVYSNVGDLVVDPFGATGDSLIAAKIESRNAIAFESNERRVQVADRRLLNESAQGDLFNS